MLTKHESKGLALARGFIVLIMPAVHSVLMYSTTAVKSGTLGTCLGFLAEQPGAQLFMLQMGLFIGIGRPKSPAQITKRFLVLLLAGYLLNFLRLVLPYCWGGLPNDFFKAEHIRTDAFTPLRLLLLGDILQFAAVGYLLCQLVRVSINSLFLKIFLLAAVIIVTPYTWTWFFSSEPVQYIAAFINGLPPKAFFPLFPWLAYPLAGLVIGESWCRIQHIGVNKVLLIAALTLVVLGHYLSAFVESHCKNTNFYRLSSGGTLFHLGMAISWLVLFNYLSHRIPPNRLFELLEWLSNNIMLVYFMQWIIIMWLLPVFGFARLDIIQSQIALVITSAISFILTYLWKAYLKPKIGKRQSRKSF